MAHEIALKNKKRTKKKSFSLSDLCDVLRIVIVKRESEKKNEFICVILSTHEEKIIRKCLCVTSEMEKKSTELQ